MTSSTVTTTEHVQPDLGTAAFQLVRGCPLLGLLDTGGRYAFRFADGDGRASRAALEYLQGGAVCARDLVAAEKTLKTMLYAQKRTGNGAGTNSWKSRQRD